MNIGIAIGDQGKQTEGVWCEHPDFEGVSFKLAYINNNDYQDYFVGAYAKARKGKKRVPAEKERAIVNIGLRKFIVKGWKGLTTTNAAGQEVEWPFNDENCKKLLAESAVLRTFILIESNDDENFGEEKQAADELGEDGEEESPTGAVSKST